MSGRRKAKPTKGRRAGGMKPRNLMAQMDNDESSPAPGSARKPSPISRRLMFDTPSTGSTRAVQSTPIMQQNTPNTGQRTPTRAGPPRQQSLSPQTARTKRSRDADSDDDEGYSIAPPKSLEGREVGQVKRGRKLKRRKLNPAAADPPPQTEGADHAFKKGNLRYYTTAPSPMNMGAQVEDALDNDDGELVGDMSRGFSLPRLGDSAFKRDLPSISASTLIKVMRQGNRPLVIIDCRYPYEFEGGHIVTARNLWRHDYLYDALLAGKKRLSGFTSDDTILIFHCEFSSERGPQMMRYIREEDRKSNTYPYLHYPEMYLLDRGYSNFYAYCNSTGNEDLCDPNRYTLMAPDNVETKELIYYRELKRNNPRHPTAKNYNVV